ncbi:hypothetical protein [Kosakonia sp. 1610]|uniref:hypothetical protein n=1 Tax=Kosakonia sp. 1610 TaxID=3156426 RepID=UPI003D1A89BA
MGKIHFAELKVVDLGNGFGKFNLNDQLYGLFSRTDVKDSKAVDIILTNDVTSFYVMGEVHCMGCAVNSIGDLYVMILEADNAYGMDYEKYKSTYSPGVQSQVKH